MNGVKWSKIEETNPDTIIIVCTGPSLINFNFENIKDKGYIIAVNDAGKFIPTADAWFTLDPWGLDGKQIPKGFTGKLIAAVPDDFGNELSRTDAYRINPNPNISYLHRVAFHTSMGNLTMQDYVTWGLNEDKRCINTGNSGFGALNLAYHMNPKRVIIFGLDASNGYFFDKNKFTRSLNHLPWIFRSTIKQLESKEIEVINASPNSKVDCFPRYTLQDAIEKLDSWQ